MAPVQPAVHRTILVVDVAGFGNRQRTHTHQLVMRQGLYNILNQERYSKQIVNHRSRPSTFE
jgi:hypothetical protein